MHVAFPSKTVRGAYTFTNLLEGLACTFTDSGVVNGERSDVPLAALAGSGRNPVYIIAAAPDDFARPVDLRLYRAASFVKVGRQEGDFTDPFETSTRYNVGISNLYNPLIPSGFLVNLHRGGVYTVPAVCFVDSAGIKVPGNFVEVGSDGKWQFTTVRTNAVGEVNSYNGAALELTFSLWF